MSLNFSRGLLNSEWNARERSKTGRVPIRKKTREGVILSEAVCELVWASIDSLERQPVPMDQATWVFDKKEGEKTVVWGLTRAEEEH